MTPSLRYRFPWERRADGGESFALLDGAIRGSVRRSPAGATYTALIEPVFVLGTYGTIYEARAVVEQHVTAKVNAMLGVILPEDVKRWLMQPL